MTEWEEEKRLIGVEGFLRQIRKIAESSDPELQPLGKLFEDRYNRGEIRISESNLDLPVINWGLGYDEDGKSHLNVFVPAKNISLDEVVFASGEILPVSQK